jgi:hypothetical protein
MSGKMTPKDAWLIFGGLFLVVATGTLFAVYPLWQLLDGTSVRRPLWNPPEVVVRKGKSPEELARLEPDAERRLLLDDLKKDIVFRPSPNWLGHARPDPDKPPPGRQFPTNALLYLFLFTTVGYFFALRRKGIL